MEITAKEVEYCKLQVHYETGADQIENKKMEVLTLFKDLPVKGYRKGVKAPLDAIRLYYAKEIDNSLKQALAEEAYNNALYDQGVKPFGPPQFSNISLTRNKFSCDMEFNVRPKFELAQYKDLEIPKQDIKFDIEKETEKTLESLRNRFGESRPFEDTDVVQMGDTVIIDYAAYDGDNKIESLCGEGQLINVGQSALPGFDDNLLGMKNGDVNTFYIKVPFELLPSYAGKEVKFVVSLTMGSKITPIALDDELAIKAGKQNFAELRKAIVELAQTKYEETMRNANVQQVMNKLLATHDIMIPSWLTLSEAQYLAASSQIVWDSLSDIDKEKYLELANKNVKMSLILEAIRDAEPEAQLSDAEVLATIEKSLTQVKTKEEIDNFMMQLNKSGRLSLLAAQLRDQYTIDFILKFIKIIE